MGFDYGLVHIKYTIPPAILLTYLYRPLFTRRDAYRILFLLTVAITATIPWDSYLIRTRVWSYPSHAVLGPTVYQIPLEELFFFFIQTYDVSLLYIIWTKADFLPAYLQRANQPKFNVSGFDIRRSLAGTLGQIILFLSIVQGWALVQKGGTGTYLGLIVVWACPVLFFLWSLSHPFICRLPLSNILMPILLPTFYLWMVDTFSLQRGTWVIEEGTKCGIVLWSGLEIEEAFFFLVTNMLIVFGQATVDYSITLIDAHPSKFPGANECPSLVKAFQALLMPVKQYDSERIAAMSDAIVRLKKKSRSFYLASGMFQGRLRIDLILLYSFCRVADDLVDNATSEQQARDWIDHLRKYLDLCYGSKPPNAKALDVETYVTSTFPTETHHALLQLPVELLSSKPLYELLAGFEMDLEFSSAASNGKMSWPIGSEAALAQYGKYVAGTVAELCCDLVFHHHGQGIPAAHQASLKQSAIDMGIALQTVNIARDISVDAAIKRVYIPTDWLKEAGLAPEDILKDPSQRQVAQLRSALLRYAFTIYEQARPALEELPKGTNGPMRVAVESYMEIGRVLKQESYQVKAGRATVPRPRRAWVAWRALNA